VVPGGDPHFPIEIEKPICNKGLASLSKGTPRLPEVQAEVPWPKPKPTETYTWTWICVGRGRKEVRWEVEIGK